MDQRLRSAYDKAVRLVRAEYKLPHTIVPTFINNVDMIKSTSSGYPHFERKGKIETEIRAEARKLFHHMKRLPRERIGYPYVAPAAKGGLSEEEEVRKTRFIWMYPAAMLNCEGVYAQPLIKAYYNSVTKSKLLMTGRNTFPRLAEFLSHVNGDEGIYGVGLDFKSFDQLPRAQTIRDAFDILNDNLEHGTYWDPHSGIQIGGAGVKRRSQQAFQNIVDYFVNTPLILPNGRVIVKHIGIPSGSHFTNLIGSIVNRILLYTFMFHEEIPMRRLMTNGDDSAFLLAEEYVKDLLSRASAFFLKCFRMVINLKKSCIASSPKEMHMSGTVWPSCRAQRTTAEWMDLALYPKVYVRDSFESFQRLLGLGIAGGFRDPTYARFFQYFQTGYDCRHGPNLLDWTKLRWLEHAFGISFLPLVYKKGIETTEKIRFLMMQS